MKRTTSAAIAASILAISPACSQETAPALDVPYVPTPQEVVDMMLDMVDLKDGDVVWDLGCGDGRMVISAAKRKDIRGVGVDLDPQRIEESNENAKEAGVEEKVSFRVADLFETDFSDATVLTMYLLESVNRKLRPVILRDLAPGSRIVSNTFTMGEWKHDDTKTSNGDTFPRTIYHWVVPANITGTWNWEMEGESGTIKIDQKFQEFSGTITVGGDTHSFKDSSINGTKATFVVNIPNHDANTHTATVDGDTMTGEVEGKTWKATRVANTEVTLDPIEED